MEKQKLILVKTTSFISVLNVRVQSVADMIGQIVSNPGVTKARQELYSLNKIYPILQTHISTNQNNLSRLSSAAPSSIPSLISQFNSSIEPANVFINSYTPEAIIINKNIPLVSNHLSIIQNAFMAIGVIRK